MIEKSNEINELAKALCAAQFAFKNAEKNASNPFFKSNYADITECWRVIKEELHKNGLSLSQPFSIDNEGVIINTILMHTSGQWISSALKLIPEKKTPQGIGSCITYGRRYSISAIVCNTTGENDDDGNEASEKPEPRPAQNKPIPANKPAAKAAPAPSGVPKTVTIAAFIEEIPLNTLAVIIADYAGFEQTPATKKTNKIFLSDNTVKCEVFYMEKDLFAKAELIEGTTYKFLVDKKKMDVTKSFIYMFIKDIREVEQKLVDVKELLPEGHENTNLSK